MMNIFNLRKKTTLNIGLALALFTFSSCLADKHGDTVLDSENVGSDQAEATVVENMNRNEQIAFSKQDLATRLGLSGDVIDVSGARYVTWRSGAVGCPKPGVSYTDALVPGVWIILRVDNSIYRYHAVTGGQPFYCPEEWAEGPVVGPGAD